MSINIYPSIAKVKRNGVYENLPGFVQQSGNADIEAMIATKESDTLAQYPHPQGSYFILNDVLYQADIDIPVNGTIAVGTTCHVAVLTDNLENAENDVKDLKSSINDLQLGIVPTSAIIKNEYIETNGTITPYNGWDRTDYIPVKDYYSITAQSSGGNSGYNVFVDANKAAISSFNVTATAMERIVPDNAVYVVFSGSRAGMAALEVTFKTKESTQISEIQQFVDDETARTSSLVLNTYNENILTGSDLWRGEWKTANTLINKWQKDGSYRGMVVMSRTGSYNGYYRNVTIEAGKYTFAAYVKTSTAQAVNLVIGNSASGDGTTSTTDHKSKQFSISADTWTFLSDTFECSVGGIIAPRIENTEQATISVCGYVLYKGEKQLSVEEFMNYVPHTYHVEKDGSGDFTSLVEAINAAEKYMDSVVYVGAGTWDIIEELGNDYIESVSQYKRGVYLKNRIHLIFDPNSKVTCNYTGERSQTISWLSAFNAGVYGFTLENATIEASNCRYAVHDERDSDEDFYINKYINCRMTLDNTQSTSETHPCIGGGLGKHGYVEINGCHLQGSEGSAFFYHNSAADGAKSHIVVKDCWLDRQIAFNWYGQSQLLTNVEVCGCSLGAAIVSHAQTSDGSSPYNNINITEWNNIIRT